MSITTMSDKDIYGHISQNLEVRENEKNEFGEVFTSSVLIDELFDNLPASYWTNPKLTWLDPCSGKGNFLALAYIRLMKGLSKKIRDKTKRIQRSHSFCNIRKCSTIHYGKSMFLLYCGYVTSIISFFFGV